MVSIMAKHTVRDAVHMAVWDFVRAIHDGTLDDLVEQPIYHRGHGDDRYHPAFAKYQIQKLSGESERVITDTLATLVDEGVLERQPRTSGYTAEKEVIRWRGMWANRKNNPGFSVLWIPTLLPQSPEVTESWPKQDERRPGPITMIAKAADNLPQAERVEKQVISMGLTRQEIHEVVQSVNQDGLSFDEALAQAQPATD
jgi:hypothetical protein